MKLAKNFAAATVLVLALSFSAFAGDQQTPGGPTPPPPPPHTTATSNETPEVPQNVTGVPVTEETTDTLWYEALIGLLSIY